MAIEMSKNGLYILRLFDGMDGLWIDITEPVSRTEVDAAYAQRTCNGTKNTKYNDIDYYRVFPADEYMVFSHENYDDLVKQGLIRP